MSINPYDHFRPHRDPESTTEAELLRRLERVRLRRLQRLVEEAERAEEMERRGGNPWCRWEVTCAA